LDFVLQELKRAAKYLFSNVQDFC